MATAVQLLAPDLRVLDLALWQLALAVVATALTVRGRTHPALLVALGVAAGIALGR